MWGTTMEIDMEVTTQLAVYRSCPSVVDTEYNRDGDETLMVTLVKALSEAEGTDPTDLPPLYESVDGEALSSFLDRSENGTTSDSFFSFTYENWNVFVRADGQIRICDGSKTIEPEPVFA